MPLLALPSPNRSVIYELIHSTITGRYTLAADGRQLARSGWKFSVCFCITTPIAAGISAKFSCSKRSGMCCHEVVLAVALALPPDCAVMLPLAHSPR